VEGLNLLWVLRLRGAIGGGQKVNAADRSTKRLERCHTILPQTP